VYDSLCFSASLCKTVASVFSVASPYASTGGGISLRSSFVMATPASLGSVTGSPSQMAATTR